MKNVMKKLVSIFTITAIAVSMLCAMPIASAAVLYTEDFSAGTLPDSYVADNGPGKTVGEQLHESKNSITVDNGRLKIFIAGTETYGAITEYEHVLGDLYNVGDNTAKVWSYITDNNYTSSLKIPFSDLPKTGIVEISFDYNNPGALFGVRWKNFASIYNSNDEVVLKGIAYYDDMKSIYGGDGRRNSLTWAGYATPEQTNQEITTDNFDSGFSRGITENMTVKITLDIDNKKVNVSMHNGTNETSSTKDIYFINDITEDGYLYFEGSLSNWDHYHSYYANEFADTNIYIDNLKISSVVDYTKLPIDIKMDSDEEFVFRQEGNALTSYADTNLGGDIIAEPGNTDNKVFAITLPIALKKVANGWYAWQHLVFPYKNLAEDENLTISYRYKDTSGLGKLFWEHFGTVTTTSEFITANSDPSVLRGLSYNYDPGFATGNNAWTNLSFVGYNNNQHTYTTLAKDYAGEQTVLNVNNTKSGWWTVTYMFDRENELVNITAENEDGTKYEQSVYTINELPSDGYLRFDVTPHEATGSDVVVYIDDVKMTTWKPLAVEDTNLTETGFDAQDDIELTFNNEVEDFDTVKQAITITEADGTEVEASRISVTGSSNVATVKVAGGLKYGETTYTLTLDANVIKSVDGLMLTKEYSKEFTTKLGKSVYVSSSTALANNATTITITNPEASAKDVWVVLALYSSTNKLIGYAEGALTSVAANTTTDPITLTATNVTGEVAAAKVLLWDSSSSLIPYHIPVVVAE